MAREIRTSSRGHRTEFEQSIQGDIVRALVELVTNSDDSYKRSGKTGPIWVAFEARRKGDPPKTVRVSVIDHAGGMTEQEMETALGEVGAATSGFRKHRSVRGLLGRGLKQAAFGIGVGVEAASIKGGIISWGRLYQAKDGKLMFSKGSEYQRDFGWKDRSPRKPTKAERKAYGLDGDGSRITIIVAQDKWKVHKQFPSVKEFLQKHYGLRAILAGRKRRPVYLRAKGGSEDHPLLYEYPARKPKKALLDRIVSVPGFRGVTARVVVSRATQDLGAVNEYSDSGLVVVAEGVPIANTLFGFERSPLAKRFFGRVECDYIARLLREEDKSGSIKLISIQRVGFMPNHPFTKALTEVVAPLLGELITDEEKRQEKEQARAVSTKVQSALRDMVPELNKLLRRLIEASSEIDGETPTPEGPGPQPPSPTYEPTSAIEFYPEEIGVRAHAERRTTLFVHDENFKDGARIDVSLEGSGIALPPKKFRVCHARGAAKRKRKPDGYSALRFPVAGVQAGTNVLVTASVGDESAMLLVTVGGAKRPSPPSRPPRGGGFLADIRLREVDEKWRAHYDRGERVLWINQKHPLLRLYRPGRGAGGGDAAHRGWVAAVADAMADALFRQVISHLIEDKARIPRSDGWNPTMVELDRLWFAHAAAIHRLVERKLPGAAT